MTIKHTRQSLYVGELAPFFAVPIASPRCRPKVYLFNSSQSVARALNYAFVDISVPLGLCCVFISSVLLRSMFMSCRRCRSPLLGYIGIELAVFVKRAQVEISGTSQANYMAHADGVLVQNSGLLCTGVINEILGLSSYHCVFIFDCIICMGLVGSVTWLVGLRKWTRVQLWVQRDGALVQKSDQVVGNGADSSVPVYVARAVWTLVTTYTVCHWSLSGDVP